MKEVDAEWTSLPVYEETRDRVRSVMPCESMNNDEMVSTALDAWEYLSKEERAQLIMASTEDGDD